MDLQSFVGWLSGDTEKDVKMLANFVFQQNEEMRYLLNNLDVTNFNDLGLARYENGVMQIYTEKLQTTVKELEVKMEQSASGQITEIEATVQGLKTTVEEQGTELGMLKSTVTQNANSISAIVSGVGANGTVTAASIVAAINKAGSSVVISADHINLDGYVTIGDLEDGTTEISGDWIKSGTIEGVTFVTTGPNSYGQVVIENNMIQIGTGEIYNDTVGTTSFTDKQFRFYVGSYGRYWILDGAGMNYYDSDGTYINGFAFAS